VRGSSIGLVDDAAGNIVGILTGEHQHRHLLQEPSFSHARMVDLNTAHNSQSAQSGELGMMRAATTDQREANTRGGGLGSHPSSGLARTGGSSGENTFTANVRKYLRRPRPVSGVLGVVNGNRIQLIGSNVRGFPHRIQADAGGVSQFSQTERQIQNSAAGLAHGERLGAGPRVLVEGTHLLVSHSSSRTGMYATPLASEPG